MHLAWAQVLGPLSGRDDVVFGTVLLGRLQGGEGAERALGVFINTLPLRIDLRAHSVKGAAWRRINAEPVAAHEHATGAHPALQRDGADHAAVQHVVQLPPWAAAGGGCRGPNGWQGMQLLEAEEHSNYRLTLSVDDLGEDFSLTALAGAGIDAQRICDYLQCALHSLADALEHAPHQGFAPVDPAGRGARAGVAQLQRDPRRLPTGTDDCPAFRAASA
jgi:arthrofactin-type cyclic lipopeptide synthetase C